MNQGEQLLTELTEAEEIEYGHLPGKSNMGAETKSKSFLV